jgi:hypothetical protein
VSELEAVHVIGFRRHPCRADADVRCRSSQAVQKRVGIVCFQASFSGIERTANVSKCFREALSGLDRYRDQDEALEWVNANANGAQALLRSARTQCSANPSIAARCTLQPQIEELRVLIGESTQPTPLCKLTSSSLPSSAASTLSH